VSTLLDRLKEAVREAQWGSIDYEQGASCPFCYASAYEKEGHREDCIVRELGLEEKYDP
jgi:hypothetical protein